MPDLTALVVMDEADRLKVAGPSTCGTASTTRASICSDPDVMYRKALAPTCGLAPVISLVHEFRPLAHKEIRELFEARCPPTGVRLPPQPLDAGIGAAVARITGGNFRALNPLPPGLSKFSNALQQVTKTVVEAAPREPDWTRPNDGGNLDTA